MPELPEVETVRRSLEPLILGARIAAITVLTPGVLIDRLQDGAIGLTVTQLKRRGKFLLVELGTDCLLVAHLRMTGQFRYLPVGQPLEKHDHIRLELLLASGEAVQLIFHDQRRFGRIWLIDRSDLAEISGLSRLGPEPLDPGLDAAQFWARLQTRPRTRLKGALLDQTVIAGLGNIYVDESLHLARINPGDPAGTLDLESAGRLLDCMRVVLSQAISARGTSIKDYVDALNVRGTFQYQLQVYGRAGKPCTTCGQTLLKTILAGRTTVFCPDCQPMS